MIINHLEIINSLRKNGRDSEGIEKCLQDFEELNKKVFTEGEREIATKKLMSIAKNFNRDWTSKSINRSWANYFAKKEVWLQNSIELQISGVSPTANENASCQKGPGRNEKSYADSSKRTQRRKRQHMVANNENDTLLFLESTVKVAKKNKEHELAKILENVIMEPDKKKMRKTIENPPKLMSPLEALALYMDSDQSKDSYQQLRMKSLDQNSLMFPSYHVIQKEKQKFYPDGNLYSIKACSTCVI